MWHDAIRIINNAMTVATLLVGQSENRSHVTGAAVLFLFFAGTQALVSIVIVARERRESRKGHL